MTVFEIIITVLHRLSNGLRIMHNRVNVAVNLVCAWRSVYTRHVHAIVRSLGAAIITKSPIPRSISRYHPIDDMNSNHF